MHTLQAHDRKSEKRPPKCLLPKFLVEVKKKGHAQPPTPLLAEWKLIIISQNHSLYSLTCMLFLVPFMRERRSWRLEALLHSRCNGSEVAVYLGWRATEDQGNDGGASHVNVLETCNKIISVWSIYRRISRYQRTTQNVNF